MTGQLTIRRVRDGEVLETITASNAVKPPYRDKLAQDLDPNRPFPTGVGAPTHFGIGDSDAVPEGLLGWQFLDSEQFRDPIDSHTVSSDGRTITYTGVIEASEAVGVQVREAGLVNDPESVAFNRVVLDPVDQFEVPSGEQAALEFTTSLRPLVDL